MKLQKVLVPLKTGQGSIPVGLLLPQTIYCMQFEPKIIVNSGNICWLFCIGRLWKVLCSFYLFHHINYRVEKATEVIRFRP